MHNEKRHIIKKVVTDIVCDQVSYKSVRDIDWTQLIQLVIATLENYFDKIGDSQIVRIDSLSLDINIVESSIPELESVISKEIIKELEKVTDIYEVDQNVDLKPSAKAKFNVSENSANQSFKDFLFYLKLGQLPWHISSLKPIALEKLSDIEFKELLNILTSNAKVLERFVYQQNHETILLFCRKIYAEKAFAKVEEWYTRISKIGTLYSEKFDLVFRTRSALLQALIKSFGDTSKLDLVSSKIPLSFYELFADLIRIMYKDKTRAFVFALTELNVESQSFVKQNVDKTAFDLPNTSMKNSEIQLSNAGIILLHPFLSTFFKKLGLIERNEFQNLDCQQRAINLLHFLATGSKSCDEYDATLYKLICNVPSEQSFPKHLPISPYEIKEAETLLESVISHWSVLKNTSIGGLRANFIMRRGVLIEDSVEQFVLHVERAAADVLLDKLPWNMSMVKFPWSTHFLTIKWR